MLARLDRLVAEASDLCAQARRVGLDEARGTTLDAGEDVAVAFQTVLGKRVRDWIQRAEATVRTVQPSADTLCGGRARELRQLIDSANVAMMRRSAGRESWNAFYRSTRELQPTGTASEG